MDDEVLEKLHKTDLNKSLYDSKQIFFKMVLYMAFTTFSQMVNEKKLTVHQARHVYC